MRTLYRRPAIFVLVCLFTMPLHAVTKSWTGAVNDLWSVGGNWSDGVPPADGDSLVFPALAALVSTNDLVGLDLQSLSMGNGESGTYDISGNGITLSGGIVAYGVVTWSVPITLAASQTFDDDLELNFAGPINLNGHSLTLDGAVTRISGAITGTGSFNFTEGHLNLSGTATFAGPFTVAAGTRLNVLGTINGPTLTIGSTAILAGNGAIPAVTLSGVFVRPGNAGNGSGLDLTTGILSSGSMTMTGGSLDIVIKGTTPGTGYDQLSVTGTVSISGSALSVSVPIGPMPGHAYVIVQNDAADAIVGTFLGYPEGSLITVNSFSFQITYAGGDGNDIALIAQSGGPKYWTGAVDNLWSVSGNWSDGVPPADGDSLVLIPLANNVNVNDLSGLDLQSLSFDGGDAVFSTSGNAITLSGGIVGNGTVTWSAPITLAASQTFDDDYEINFAGPIDLNGHVLTIDAATTRISSSMTGTGSVDLTFGHLNLSGTANITGPFNVAAGSRLNVTGTLSSLTLTAGPNAVLAGTGTVPVTVLNGTLLRPGSAGNGDGVGPATGILTSGDFTMTGGSFDVAIKGPTPGSGYDQLSVMGAVTLNNPALVISLPSGSPVPGTSYVIVANDLADAVNGTFSGLPEAAAVSGGGAWFRITYAGGTGNDIVVTALETTTTTLAASPNPAPSGQPVLLTATIASSAGTPTGTVRFVEMPGARTLALTTLDASGLATATVRLAAGAHTIEAWYEGEGAFAPSQSAPLTLTISPVAAIPALGEIGFLALAIAIAFAGVVALKRA